MITVAVQKQPSGLWALRLLLISVTALVCLLLPTAAGQAKGANLIRNGDFAGDLSGWRVAGGGNSGEGFIIHDDRAYGLHPGSLRVETRRQPRSRFKARVEQEIADLPSGAKLRLSFWWRKLVGPQLKQSRASISMYLESSEGVKLPLWEDKSLPPLAGGAVSGRQNNFEAAPILEKGGNYRFVVSVDLRGPAGELGNALVQLDDIVLETAKPEQPILFAPGDLEGREAAPGTVDVEALSFTAKSTLGKDALFGLTLVEPTGSPSLFGAAKLFMDMPPLGELNSGDRLLGRSTNKHGFFQFTSLSLPLERDKVPLLAVVDVRAKAGHGQGQALTFVDYKGYFDQTGTVSPVFGPRVGIDAAPPPPATGLAAAGGGRPILSWTNPADQDFYKYRLVRKASEQAAGPFDKQARLVVEAPATPGSFVSFIDMRAGRGRYVYTVYTADRAGNWQEGVIVGGNSDLLQID